MSAGPHPGRSDGLRDSGQRVLLNTEFAHHTSKLSAEKKQPIGFFHKQVAETQLKLALVSQGTRRLRSRMRLRYEASGMAGPRVQLLKFCVLSPFGSTAFSVPAQFSNRRPPRGRRRPLVPQDYRLLGAYDFRRKDGPSFIVCIYLRKGAGPAGVSCPPLYWEVRGDS